MDFATELVTGGGNPGTGRNAVKTGDQTKIMLYVVMTLAAGLVLLLTAVIRLRRDREEAISLAEETRGKTAGRRQR